MLTKRIRKSSEILLGLSVSIRKPYALDRLVGSGYHGAEQRSWKARPAGIPNPSGQHWQCQTVARSPGACSLKRWWEMIAGPSLVLAGVCGSGREFRFVTRWGSGRHGRGHDSRLRDVNGGGIFAGLIQSLSEKTEGIPPVSLIFGQDSNPKHSGKKISQGIFCKASWS